MSIPRKNKKSNGKVTSKKNTTTTKNNSSLGNPKVTNPEELSYFRRNFYNNLYPYNYDMIDPTTGQKLSALERGVDAVVFNNKESFKEEFDTKVKNDDQRNKRTNNVRRDDANRVYVGLPQLRGTFDQSTYEPSVKDEGIFSKVAKYLPDFNFFPGNFESNSKKDKRIYKINNPEQLAYIKELANNPELFDEKGVFIDKDNVSGIMGNYKVSKGKDEKGDYLSYYDKWDLEPFRNTKLPFIEDISIPIGNSYEVYDRVYLNDNSVKPTKKSKKQVEKTKERVKEDLRLRKIETEKRKEQNRRMDLYGSKFQYGGDLPDAQFGLDIFNSGPLADIFKSGKEWDKAWRGDIFDKSGLINKTIYENQKGMTSEKMYNDPNSPFYDPNYQTNIDTSRKAAEENYQSQYESMLKEKEEKGAAFDERDWGDINNSGNFIENYVQTDSNVTKYNPKSDAQKFQNTAQGVFSGLKYQSAYQKPEPIYLESGFQGTQWAKYGKNVDKPKRPSIAERFNNPMSLTYTDTTKSYGATDSGQKQLDGDLNFAKFDSPIAGINAARQLLKQKYADKTIDEALKKYSNRNYDSSIIKSLPRNAKIKDLNDEQFNRLFTTIGKNEMPAEVYADLSAQDMFNPMYEENQRRKEKSISSMVNRGNMQRDNTSVNRMLLPNRLNGGYIDYAQMGSEVDPTSTNNMYADTDNIVNYTGYTPGTRTSNNKINIIPGDTVTTTPEFGPPVTEPILTIANFNNPKNPKGTNHGLINILNPGETKQIVGANKIVELPMKKSSSKNAKYGSSITKGKRRYGGNISDIINRNLVPNLRYGNEIEDLSMEDLNRLSKEDLINLINMNQSMSDNEENEYYSDMYDNDESEYPPFAYTTVAAPKKSKARKYIDDSGEKAYKRYRETGGIGTYQFSGLVNAANTLYNVVGNPETETGKLYGEAANFKPLVYGTPEASAYLKELAGNEQLSPEASSPEFNKKMIDEYNRERKNALLQKANRAVANEVKQNYESNPYGYDPVKGRGNQYGISEEQSNPYGYDPNTGKAKQIGTSPSSKIKGSDVKEVYNIKGDRTWEYAKDANGNWLTRKRGSNSDWTTISNSNLSADKAKEASSILDAQAYRAGTETNKQKSTPSKKSNSNPNSGIMQEVMNSMNNGKIISTPKTVKQLKWDPILKKHVEVDVPISVANSTLSLSDEAKARLTKAGSNALTTATLLGLSGVRDPRILGIAGGLSGLEGGLFGTDYIDSAAGLYGAYKGGRAAWNLTKSGTKKAANAAKNAANAATNNAAKNAANTANTANAAKNTPKPEVKGPKGPEVKGPKLSGEKNKKKIETSRYGNYIPYYQYGAPINHYQFGGEVKNFSKKKILNGGYNDNIPSYQYGGQINYDHTYPIHPITEDFTEIQTEKGETVFLPDGTIVDVKATDLHKNMDKNKVTDILPEGSYIFSNDKQMKFKLNEKIGGVKIKDMKLGKTVFEYKENELTTGPEDIMFSDIFNGKDNLTPAELTNNIKKKFEVRDMKDDFFVSRANSENKEQRVEYLNILKAFSEFKKPRSKREVPKAQYGTYLDSNMDLPQAGIGDFVNVFNPINWIGRSIVGKRAERENQQKLKEFQGAYNQKEKDLRQTGALGIGTNLATYAASLNAPDIKFNDYQQERALSGETYDRMNLLNEANKYSLAQGLGPTSSLSRYSNVGGMGNYLAQSAAANQALMQSALAQQSTLGLGKMQDLNRYTTAGLDNYNNAANTKAQQIYNANISGLSNVGRSAADYTKSMGDFRFDRTMNTMQFKDQLEAAKRARKDRFSDQLKSITEGGIQLGMQFLPGGAFASKAGNVANTVANTANTANTIANTASTVANTVNTATNSNSELLDRINYLESLVSGSTVNRQPPTMYDKFSNMFGNYW